MGRKLSVDQFDQAIPGGKATDWVGLKSLLRRALHESGFLQLNMTTPGLRQQLRDELVDRIHAMPRFVRRAYRDDADRCLEYLMLYAYKVKNAYTQEINRAQRRQALRSEAATETSTARRRRRRRRQNKRQRRDRSRRRAGSVSSLSDSETDADSSQFDIPIARRRRSQNQNKRRRRERSRRRTGSVSSLSDSETDAYSSDFDVSMARRGRPQNKRRRGEQSTRKAVPASYPQASGIESIHSTNSDTSITPRRGRQNKRRRGERSTKRALSVSSSSDTGLDADLSDFDTPRARHRRFQNRTKRRRRQPTPRRAVTVSCSVDSEGDASAAVQDIATRRPQTRSQMTPQQEKEGKEAEPEQEQQERQQQHPSQPSNSPNPRNQTSDATREWKIIVWDFNSVSHSDLVKYLREHEKYDPGSDGIQWADPAGTISVPVSNERTWKMALNKMGKLRGPSWLKVVRNPPSAAEIFPSSQPAPPPNPAPRSASYLSGNSIDQVDSLFLADIPWRPASPSFEETPSPAAHPRVKSASSSAQPPSPPRIPSPTQLDPWAGRTRRRAAVTATRGTVGI
ncbi:uncharacterized protein BO66DRAFT_396369 [Aspergillus aculeatinus CBS 121060]|uniref:Uncharacterized protein n=1 Tax=Aspergillus aculeatinus CBS 121060 TaxID=1448322 RepID=A0ACD1GS99_9EURO|nr:hypothetical protein BO66DRAFT_396369 [Aspergillus aculeatinus CBS 121060]RAH64239.1 hypothetical protein BO66DRAFT_396369 [Aspergillus aculeatinus CBS 121060]